MSYSGKGDKARPLAVPREQFEKQFDSIFGKKPPREPFVYKPESQDNKQKDNK